MNEQIIEQLKQIIADELDVNIAASDIDADASLFEEGLGLDSVVIVELITLIEQHFHIQFAEDQLNMELFANLTALANGIAQHQEELSE